MKLHLLIATSFFLVMTGCAHTQSNDENDKVSDDKQEATCVPPEGQDKCTTGGGLIGPIEPNQAPE